MDYLSGAWLLLFLFALAVAECLLYVRTKKGWLLYFGVVAGLFLALTALGYSAESNTLSTQQRPVRLVIVIALQVLVPLVAIACAVSFLSKIRHGLTRHALVAASAFAVMLAWPLFALVVVCSSGLDCI
jgi:hypothetical protein